MWCSPYLKGKSDNSVGGKESQFYNVDCRRGNLLVMRLLFAGVLVMSSCKNSADDHARKGDAYFEETRYQEAVVEYRNAITLAPGDQKVKYKLAKAYRLNGNLQAATEEYLALIAVNPKHLEAMVELGSLYLSGGQSEKAEALIAESLKGNPENAVAHSLKGQYLIISGDAINGLAELEKAVRLSPNNVELYEPLATFHSAKGRPDVAMAVLQEAAEKNPRAVAATLNLAQFQFQLGKVQEAEVNTRRALSLESRHLKATLFLAQILSVTSRLPEAETLLIGLKTIAPDDPIAYRALSVFYETTGQRGKAITELKLVEKKHFRDLVVKQRLVENLLVSGQLQEVEAINQRIKKAAPESAYPLYTDGRVHMARQEFAAAIASINEAIGIEGRAEYYHTLGIAQASLGMIKQARESLQQALTVEPRRVDSLLALASLAMDAGKGAFALQAAEQVLRRNPKSVEAKTVRAQALLVRGQTSEGEQELEEVLSHNSLALPALGLLVDLKVAQGKSRDMEKRLRILLADHPSVPELHLLLGIVRYAYRDLDGSEKSLREAIRLKQNVKAAHQVLANVLQDKGDTAGFKKILQAAIVADPSNLSNYLRLAAEYDREKELEEAKKILSAARNVDPSSPVLANYYAYLLLETNGDRNLALALAQQAKEKMPGSPDVADTLGWAYHKRGMHDQAIKQFKAAIQAKPDEPAFYYHLGEAYIALKNWSEAKSALTRSLASPAFGDRSRVEAALQKLPK